MGQKTLEYSARPAPRNTMGYRILKRLHRIGPYLLAVMLSYVGSYVALSEFGDFYPSVSGMDANGPYVKWYTWTPAGFHRGFRPRVWLFYLYLPLYEMDRLHWHHDDDVYDGKYPFSEPSNDAEWAEWMGR